MVKVRVTTETEITLTPENERDILMDEYERRYEWGELKVGDEVKVRADIDPYKIRFVGPDFENKPGFVFAIGDYKNVGVLVINSAGEFAKVWADEDSFDLVKEGV